MRSVKLNCRLKNRHLSRCRVLATQAIAPYSMSNENKRQPLDSSLCLETRPTQLYPIPDSHVWNLYKACRTCFPRNFLNRRPKKNKERKGEKRCANPSLSVFLSDSCQSNFTSYSLRNKEQQNFSDYRSAEGNLLANRISHRDHVINYQLTCRIFFLRWKCTAVAKES